MKKKIRGREKQASKLPTAPLDRNEEPSLSELDVKTRLTGLSDAQAVSVVCALVGHSRVQTTFFGYFYCARCGAQVGDSLASIYPGAAQAVIVDHHCDTCRENAKALTWRDTFKLPKTATDYLKLLANVRRSKAYAVAAEKRHEKVMAKLRAKYK